MAFVADVQRGVKRFISALSLNLSASSDQDPEFIPFADDPASSSLPYNDTAEVGVQYLNPLKATPSTRSSQTNILGSLTRQHPASIAPSLGDYQTSPYTEVNSHEEDALDVLKRESPDNTAFTKLYQGTQDPNNVTFQKQREKIVAREGLSSFKPQGLAKSDPCYFRKIFMNYVNQHQVPSYTGTAEARKNNPTGATITMAEMLGEKGVKLYELALKEEAESTAFRDAVFLKSASFYEGNAPKERPVIFNGGPSGSGKSYSLKAVVGKIMSDQPSSQNERSGCFVVSSDGGVTREVSQIYNFTVKLANKNGYAGVSDVYKHSKNSLSPIKKYVLNALMESKTLGIAIAETFSKWAFKAGKFKSLIGKLKQLPATRVFFSSIQGKDPDKFAAVVKQMGMERALETDPDPTTNLATLNTPASKESKAYKSHNTLAPGVKVNTFQAGVDGTDKAAKYCASQGITLLTTENDLTLVIQKPPGSGQWTDRVMPGEQGVKKISARVFNAWQELKAAKTPEGATVDKWVYKQDLMAFNKANQANCTPNVRYADSPPLTRYVSAPAILQSAPETEKPNARAFTQRPGSFSA